MGSSRACGAACLVGCAAVLLSSALLAVHAWGWGPPPAAAPSNLSLPLNNSSSPAVPCVLDEVLADPSREDVVEDMVQDLVHDVLEQPVKDPCSEPYGDAGTCQRERFLSQLEQVHQHGESRDVDSSHPHGRPLNRPLNRP